MVLRRRRSGPTKGNRMLHHQHQRDGGDGTTSRHIQTGISRRELLGHFNRKGVFFKQPFNTCNSSEELAPLVHVLLLFLLVKSTMWPNCEIERPSQCGWYRKSFPLHTLNFADPFYVDTDAFLFVPFVPSQSRLEQLHIPISSSTRSFHLSYSLHFFTTTLHFFTTTTSSIIHTIFLRDHSFSLFFLSFFNFFSNHHLIYKISSSWCKSSFLSLSYLRPRTLDKLSICRGGIQVVSIRMRQVLLLIMEITTIGRTFCLLRWVQRSPFTQDNVVLSSTIQTAGSIWVHLTTVKTNFVLRIPKATAATLMRVFLLESLLDVLWPVVYVSGVASFWFADEDKRSKWVLTMGNPRKNAWSTHRDRFDFFSLFIKAFVFVVRHVS